MARSPGGSGRSSRDRGRDRDRDEDNELKDKLVTINRVAKVVKGGRLRPGAARDACAAGGGRKGHCDRTWCLYFFLPSLRRIVSVEYLMPLPL